MLVNELNWQFRESRPPPAAVYSLSLSVEAEGEGRAKLPAAAT